MRRIVKTVIEKVEYTAEFCDICENQLGAVEKLDGSREWLHEETAVITFNFGYLSDNNDGDQGSFILCQECAKDLHEHLTTLSPNFKLTNYMSNDD